MSAAVSEKVSYLYLHGVSARSSVVSVSFILGISTVICTNQFISDLQVGTLFIHSITFIDWLAD
jgi:hypothetical protein